MINIKYSVGAEGRNKSIDVAVIQSLLKSYFNNNSVNRRKSDFSRLNVNGLSSFTLIEAIKSFQKIELSLNNPDGRVDPNGATFKKLTALTKNSHKQPINNLLFSKNPIHVGLLSKVSTSTLKKFFRQYHGLTISKGEDFTGFFDMLKKDTSITDIRWAAYILATAYHETTYSFKPIQEDGLGAGEDYSTKYTVTDTRGIRGKPGNTYSNVYYGRGYVQLTWISNYKEMSEVLFQNDDLYINPDLALDKVNAYNITSYGMINGTFTTKKLSNYIHGNKADYFNARRIINGIDRAKKISLYAHSIEILLRLAACSASPIK